MSDERDEGIAESAPAAAQEPLPQPRSSDETVVEKADTIARKYFAIWIWSVVVGLVTSNSLSITDYHVQARGNFLILLIAPILVITSAFTIASWFYIAAFMRSYIVPIFFYGEEPRYHSVRLLNRAVTMSVYAIIFRLMLALADTSLYAVSF